MDKPDLHATLQQLHTELLPIEVVDANHRRKIVRLMAAIQELMKQKEDHPPEKLKQLVAQLREGIKLIEVSHPTATGVMGRTIDMLARMGI